MGRRVRGGVPVVRQKGRAGSVRGAVALGQTPRVHRVHSLAVREVPGRVEWR